MNAIFSARSDEESYSDYAKYAAITHNELLKTRWSFYEKSIIGKFPIFFYRLHYIVGPRLFVHLWQNGTTKIACNVVELFFMMSLCFDN